MPAQPKTLLKAYLQRLADITAAGDAREESYYGALADLLRLAAEATGRAHIHVTVLPKKTEAGNPDMHTPIVGAEDWPTMPSDPDRGPDTVAPAAVFFASDESRLCNGTELVMDRGHHAGQAIDLPGFLFERP